MPNILPALTHRALRYANARRRDDATGRAFRYYEPRGTVRLFVAVTENQERQSDTDPMTPSQLEGKIFLVAGSVAVGDRLEITRPAGLGTFQITDLTPVFDGFGVSHVEAQAVQVTVP